MKDNKKGIIKAVIYVVLLVVLIGVAFATNMVGSVKDITTLYDRSKGKRLIQRR